MRLWVTASHAVRDSPIDPRRFVPEAGHDHAHLGALAVEDRELHRFASTIHRGGMPRMETAQQVRAVYRPSGKVNGLKFLAGLPLAALSAIAMAWCLELCLREDSI